MKKLVISALIAGISATAAPLYAQTAAADSIEQQVFDKSFDVAVLSPQEMQETEGAFSLTEAMVTGAASNAIVYTAGHAMAGDLKAGGVVGAAAAGAFGGLVGKIYTAYHGLAVGTELAILNEGIFGDYNEKKGRDILNNNP